MPDLYLDASVAFHNATPSPDDLLAHGVRGILTYSRVSTAPRWYIDECLSKGIVVSPIFETGGTRPYDGYQAGRDDGETAAGDLDSNFGMGGVPDGVRCFVNMADTPASDGHEGAIRDYAQGFAETFPTKWQLGSYGDREAIYAARAVPRFDKLWAVETWGAPPGNVDSHWQYWTGQPDVALVQMANVPDPWNGQTDTNWLVPGQTLDAWGGLGYDAPPTVHGIRYPLPGAVRVNSPWGPRAGGFHYGIDLWAEMVTPCIAVADGTCFYYGFEPGGGGNHLAFYFDVPPSPAAPKFGYMHLDHAVVAPGQHVTAGDIVAYSNNTGASSGPHLHFWMGTNANSGAVDPTPFLLAPPPSPPKPPEGGHSMVIIVDDRDFTKCWLMVGNVRIKDFDGPPGYAGIPQDAIDYSNQGQIPIRALNTQQLGLVDAVSKMLLDGGIAHYHETNRAPEPPPVEPEPEPTDLEVGASRRRHR